jgi:histone-lysine N-methyltransferase SETD2
MKTTEEIIRQPEPRTKFISRDPPKPETYHRKRRFVEQPHNGSYGLNSSSLSELDRQAVQKELLHQQSVREIIAAAADAALAAAAAAAVEAGAIAEAKAKADAAAEKAARKKEKSIKISLTPEEHEANKEKRLLKLIGAVVVKCMSKYSKSFDHDAFKKHAKEV